MEANPCKLSEWNHTQKIDSVKLFHEFIPNHGWKSVVRWKSQSNMTFLLNLIEIDFEKKEACTKKK